MYCPLDIMIEIIECMPFNDSKNFCIALKLPIYLAYQYHNFKIKQSDFSLVCHEIQQTLNCKYFKFLIKNTKFRWTFKQEEIFLIASYLGSTLQVYNFLQQSDIDPSFDHNHAIRLASREGNAQVVELLLQDSRVDASAVDNQAIKWASFYKHLPVVKLLADHLGLDSKQHFGPIVIINADRDRW